MQVQLNLNPTKILAVWGACVATLVLLWDIYKWRTSGPRISFTASPDWTVCRSKAYSENKPYINAKAINKGDRPTTITNLGFRYYDNWFNKFCHKSSYRGVVINLGSQPLPHVLEPGAVWNGLTDQHEVEEKISKNGILLFELELSHTSKPKKVRVRL